MLLKDWEELKVRVIQGGNHIMMAMETSITKDGVSYREVEGTPQEQKEMEESYAHLCKLRDEVIAMGLIPSIDKWHELNKNID